MFCSLSAGTRLARISLDKRFQTAQSLWMSIFILQGFESQSSQTPSRHFKRHIILLTLNQLQKILLLLLWPSHKSQYHYVNVLCNEPLLWRA